MIVEHDPRRRGPHGYGPADPYAQDPRAQGLGAQDPRAHPPSRGSALRRFLGGSPAGVLVRLVFLSILAGALMATLGLTPGRLFWHAADALRALLDLGFAAAHDFGGWLLAGALVVVPLWLVARLFAVSR